jgi:hypothetical protein
VHSGEIKTAKDLRELVAPIIPVDEDFRKAFELASVRKSAFARYYLRSLEMAAQGDATPWFVPNDDRETINLEHVLPEQPEGNWPHFDPESARSYSRRIGNLALMLAKTNSDLKSAPFSTKKAAYVQSPYATTKMIGECDAWTSAAISERQKKQAALAVKAWPL